MAALEEGGEAGCGAGGGGGGGNGLVNATNGGTNRSGGTKTGDITDGSGSGGSGGGGGGGGGDGGGGGNPGGSGGEDSFGSGGFLGNIGCKTNASRGIGLSSLGGSREAFIGNVFWALFAFTTVVSFHAAAIHCYQRRSLRRDGKRAVLPTFITFPRIELQLLLACFHGIAFSSMQLLAETLTREQDPDQLSSWGAVWIVLGLLILAAYPLALTIYVNWHLKSTVRAFAGFSEMRGKWVDHLPVTLSSPDVESSNKISCIGSCFFFYRGLVAAPGDEQSASSTRVSTASFVARYGTLFESFKRRYFWWRSPLLIIRLISGALLSNIVQLPETVLAVLLIILYLGYAIVCAVTRPYIRVVTTVMEVMLFLLYAAIASAPLIAAGLGGVDCARLDAAMTAMCTFAIVLVVFRGVVSVFRMLVRKYRRGKGGSRSRSRSRDEPTYGGGGHVAGRVVRVGSEDSAGGGGGEGSQRGMIDVSGEEAELQRQARQGRQVWQGRQGRQNSQQTVGCEDDGGPVTMMTNPLRESITSGSRAKSARVGERVDIKGRHSSKEM